LRPPSQAPEPGALAVHKQENIYNVM